MPASTVESPSAACHCTLPSRTRRRVAPSTTAIGELRADVAEFAGAVIATKLASARAPGGMSTYISPRSSLTAFADITSNSESRARRRLPPPRSAEQRVAAQLEVAARRAASAADIHCRCRATADAAPRCPASRRAPARASGSPAFGRHRSIQHSRRSDQRPQLRRRRRQRAHPAAARRPHRPARATPLRWRARMRCQRLGRQRRHLQVARATTLVFASPSTAFRIAHRDHRYRADDRRGILLLSHSVTKRLACADQLRLGGAFRNLQHASRSPAP